jgi:glycerol-1-phosphate dehydrogenase [NAD(P)+]
MLPQFVELGQGKIRALPVLLKTHEVSFDRVLLLYDDTTLRIGGQKISRLLTKHGASVIGHSIENSKDANVAIIRAVIKQHVPDLLIGFGGGKVLDVAKLAAGRHGVRFISIPTTLSNDGLSSPVSVIKDRRNIPISHITTPPYGVVIDIDVVRQAPPRHLLAGVGDLLSNLSAVFDARLAQGKKHEEISDNALELSEAGGRALVELRTNNISSSDFLQHLAHGLLKSGFAMCISGTSRPASGSEHKISHSIDHYFPPGKSLHGEQVGIAAIFTMLLQGNDFRKKVDAFYRSIGFPTKISYLGLNEDEFTRVVQNATKIRPERYTILEDLKPSAQDIRRALRAAKL